MNTSATDSPTPSTAGEASVPRGTLPAPSPDAALAPRPGAPADDDDRLTTPPLAFTGASGPLVAVCGLQGGAGTSTLANLIAETAASAESGPIVVCEAPGASGDQAALTGAPSRLSLAELAVAVAAGRPPRGFWGRRGALRVLATAPRPAPALAGDALVDVLAAARAEHALTVVDVGTVRDAHARPILEAATHVVWMLRLEPGAVERARVTLASRLVPALAARQALAARGARPRDRFAGEGGALRRLAAEHAERLVLVPELPVRDGRPDPSSGRARRLTTGLTRFLGAPCPA
jgi:hypothetical protein